MTLAFATGTAIGWSAALPPATGAIVTDMAITDTWPVKPDFDLVFASLNVPPQKQDGAKQASAKQDSEKIVTMNFAEVFASVASLPRDNTPSRREKLRNAGWRRLLSVGAKPAVERVSAGEGRTAVN